MLLEFLNKFFQMRMIMDDLTAAAAAEVEICKNP
jgi:hypothetical protein